MKKFNKVIALMLVLIMALSLCACGKSSSSAPSGGGDETKTETPSTDGDEKTEEPDDGGSASAGGDFYVYSWNTEVGERLEAFFKEYDADAYARIKYVNTASEQGPYLEKIDTLLQATDAEDYPDMIALEAASIKKYVSTDLSLSMDDLGITADDYKNAYEYTLDVAKDERDGKIKGLSWQAAPGAFTYRRSLAKKYLGTEEPDEVQEYVKDWSTFLETAKTLKEKGDVAIIPDIGDAANPFLTSRTQAWVVDGKLTIDPNMDEYLEVSKTLKQEGYTKDATPWQEAWYAGPAGDEIFAYFGCTWFLHWTIKANCGGEKVGEGTFGDWAMCRGPVAYYWGGTWLVATAGCSDKELAKEIMIAMCCDTDTMYNIADQTLDYVNNKEAVAKLIADGKGPYEFLGGQDFLALFEPIAGDVDVSIMTGYDSQINDLFSAQLKLYAQGDKDKDTALADFKAAVKDKFPELNVE